MSVDNSHDAVQWLRHAAPYIQLHRGKTFVIMLAGEAMIQPNIEQIMADIALMHTLGVKLVVVYGARPQINQQLELYGLQTEFLQHRRVTTRQTIGAVSSAVGAIRLQIEAMLANGIAYSPMYGARIGVVSGNFVTAKPYGIHDGIDFELTGEVRSTDAERIHQYLADHSIVLLGPTGHSSTGEVFNLRAEEVATQVAIDLQADKLIFMGKDAGYLTDDQQLLRELTSHDVKQLLVQQQDRSSERYLHLQGAWQACEQGVARCHLLSYQQDGALLQELFTLNGVGTLISRLEFEGIRRAQIDDIGGLLNLLQPLEQQGILVYRSRSRLEQDIEHFAVIERDGLIVACAALYPLDTTANELPAAEIACVAVHPEYRKSQRGAQILQFLQHLAAEKGIRVVYVLTTHTGHWFMEQGFSQISPTELPQSRLARYNTQRKSQVYRKLLN